MANIGIDLGTTNSLVAVVMGGKARALLDDDGQAILPSAVRYLDEGVLVGQAALHEAAENAAQTLTSVKRLMGRSMQEARAEADQLHYALAEGEDSVVRVQVGDKAVTPIEVSAEILRVLKERATELLLSEPGGAVITVPAYFDDAQRQATRDAGRLAGLNVLRLLNEPTAAAIAYGLQERSEGVFAVYDLGGGTFDISILRLEDGVFQVLSTAGDTHLGGDDFDRRLAAQILDAAGLSGAGGGLLRAAIEAAEDAKKQLTDSETATVRAQLGAQAVEFDISRAEYEALIQDIVQRTLEACQRAVTDAELRLEEIDGVVLVGGSTRMPIVRRWVEQYFGREPFGDIDPDQVVALGAAMQADILTGESELAEDVLLMDIVPLSLGIETMGGVVEKLIWRCSPIPAAASETFTTHVDGQSAVDLHVVQGERELAKDCRSLAKFKLRGIPGMPAGLPRVKVEFLVDADGILHVSATEQYTGTHAEVDVTPSYGLEEEEIERMLEESIDFAEEDVDERMLIEARVEADQILTAVKKALASDPDMLIGNEAEVIGQVVEALDQALTETDRHRINKLSKKLDEVTAPFAQRRIERDLQRALRGQSALEVADKLDRSAPAPQ
ncbi:MAG: Fe-S protein assembly chaperone HscA [Alphaproteobacteria bacterium]|nr:Fe-S protein assembly chaperone HscA [Alphaproteobacteria bacterium]MCB9792016.1 Fe-S protein assembly chaperone HscA [Alphaproteobacteria bacterium]